MDMEHQFTHLLRHDRSRVLVSTVQKLVVPGDRVLDAGTGTGILALLASRAGAKSVTAVDIGDLTLAREIARDNSCEASVQFILGDLGEIALPDAPFDTLVSFVYLNDLRRDESRSRLVFELKNRFLKAKGRILPDSVRYQVQPLDWPAQDIRLLRSNLRTRLVTAEQELGLSLSSIERRIDETVIRNFFPERSLETGKLDCTGATPMSKPTHAFTIDYDLANAEYPTEVSFSVERPGTPTALLWQQDLMFQNEIVFRNECLSWIANPTTLNANQHCVIALDARWRQTNVHGARVS